MYKIFKDLLEEQSISAYKVSKETGIPQSTFTDWRKGRSKPKVEKLLLIADFFNVDVRVFINKGELKRQANN